jgi:bifunctional non-homologous end joining protein LigD
VAGQGKAFFEAAAALDLEGVVAKRRTSAYHERRSRDWIKIKTTRTGEFVIAGYTPSSGSRKYFGALVLGLYGAGDRLVYVGRAGSGFDSKSLKSVFGDLLLRRRETSAFDVVPDENANVQWVEPELVCSVRFNEWTPDGKLRAPVFVSLCEDIEPSECVLREEPSGDIEPESRGPESDSVRSEAEAGPHKVELTNLNKVFWPDDGWTKGDLIHFYREVAEFLNPHLDQRLLVLKRYPNGITGEHFYQKDSPGHTPAWVPTAEEWSEETERSIRYVVGGRTDTLVYLANLGAISVNPWHSRIGRLDRPDYAIFDLDPGPGVEFDVARKVALELKRVLDDLELRAYPKTSGATGIHVYLPLIEDAFSYQDVRVFTEAIASIVVARVPELATIERVVRRRPVAVYVDYLQNVRGKTVAAVYSVRARPGAPVSTPLGWGELGRRFEPTRFHMKNLFRRLARTGDLFGPVLTDRQDIAPFLEALSPKR